MSQNSRFLGDPLKNPTRVDRVARRTDAAQFRHRDVTKEAVMAKNSAEWCAKPRFPASHYVDSRIYTDQAIFEEEEEKLF